MQGNQHSQSWPSKSHVTSILCHACSLGSLVLVCPDFLQSDESNCQGPDPAVYPDHVGWCSTGKAAPS